MYSGVTTSLIFPEFLSFSSIAQPNEEVVVTEDAEVMFMTATGATYSYEGETCFHISLDLYSLLWRDTCLPTHLF